jgi:hypothetical protein
MNQILEDGEFGGSVRALHLNREQLDRPLVKEISQFAEAKPVIRLDLVVQASAAWPATLSCGVGPSKERSVEITWIWLVACSSRSPPASLGNLHQNRLLEGTTALCARAAAVGAQVKAVQKAVQQTSTPAFTETLEIAGNEKKHPEACKSQGDTEQYGESLGKTTKPGEALQKAVQSIIFGPLDDDELELLALTLAAHRQGNIE